MAQTAAARMAGTDAKLARATGGDIAPASIVTVARPAPGTMKIIDLRPGDLVHFDFPLKGAKLVALDVDAVIVLPDDAKLLLPGFLLNLVSDEAGHVAFADTSLTADEFVGLIGDVRLTDTLTSVSLSSDDETKAKSEGQGDAGDAAVQIVQVVVQGKAGHSDDRVEAPASLQQYMSAPVTTGSTSSGGRSGAGQPPASVTPDPMDGSGNQLAAKLTPHLLGSTTAHESFVDANGRTHVYGASAKTPADTDESYSAQYATKSVQGTSSSDVIRLDSDPATLPDGSTYSSDADHPGTFVRVVKLDVEMPNSGWSPTSAKIVGLPPGYEVLNGEKVGNGYVIDMTGDPTTLYVVVRYVVPPDSAVPDQNGFLSKFNLTVQFTTDTGDATTITSGTVAFGIREVHSEDDTKFGSADDGDLVMVLPTNPPGTAVDAGVGDDTVIAGAGADTADGGQGSDTISYAMSQSGVTIDLKQHEASGGFARGDLLTSFENIIGSRQNDSLVGDDGDNRISGGGGADTIDGGIGTDTADYGTSAAKLTIDLADSSRNSGDAQGDVLRSIEVLFGSTFDDQISGTAEAETLVGGDGNDTIEGRAGPDSLVGGNGAADILAYSADTVGLEVDLQGGWAQGGDADGDTISGFEGVLGGSGADILKGDDGSNLLVGGQGNDLLEGRGGADTLDGGEGDDTLRGGSGSNLLDGGAGNDVGDWSDVASGVEIDLTREAGGGAASGDRIRNIEIVIGSAHADTLSGGASSTTLIGGDGDDDLRSGRLADSLVGGQGSDRVSYDRSLDAVVVDLAAGTGHGGDAEGDSYVSIDRVVGSSFDDTLIGTAGAETLSGGAANGNDSLWGGGGADSLVGGGGNDTLVAGPSTGEVLLDGGTGNDWLVADTGPVRALGGAGFDVVDFSHISGNIVVDLGNQTLGGAVTDGIISDVEGLVAGSGNDWLIGSADANLLEGGAANDTLDGAAGADTMIGGSGNDLYFVDSPSDAIVEDSDSVGGIDTVRVRGASSYTLADGLENLVVDDPNITQSLRAVGNDADNRIEAAAGRDTIDGGAGNDTLVGGKGDDLYYVDSAGDRVVEVTGEGNDTIVASGDAPTDLAVLSGVENLVYGGANVVRVVGTSAANLLQFLSGSGTIDGGAGNDTLLGWSGDDTLLGGDGNDSVNAGAGNDSLVADTGTNTLIGGDGHDTLVAGSGNDSLVGGDGDDVYVLDASSQSAKIREFGGDGTDEIRTAGGSYTLDAGNNVENLTYTGSGDFTGIGNELDNVLTGAGGNDSLTGGSGKDSLVGLAGNDTLDGGLGDDSLSGGDGNDSLVAGEGADTVLGGAGDDTLVGGPGVDSLLGGDGDDTYVVDGTADVVVEEAAGGTDTLLVTNVTFIDATANYANIEHVGYSGTQNVTIVGGDTNDYLQGDQGNDSVLGQNGDDTLFGGAGNDTLLGGAGNDSLLGGTGNDYLVVDSATDVVIETDTVGNDTVEVSGTGSTSLATYTNVEHLIYLGSGNVSLTGSAADNWLVGGSGNETLDAQGGNDSLVANAGDDWLLGGAGSDSLSGGEGNDTLDGGTENDTLLGGDGDDSLAGGAGTNRLDGGQGNDVYIVTSATDVLSDSGTTGRDGERTTLTNVTLASSIEDLTFTGGSASTGLGNASANRIAGTAFADSLLGLGGDDTLTGNGGADTLDGGAGNDWLDAASSSVNTRLIGGTENDTLLAGSGNDTLDGGAGADSMVGGAGNDYYMVDNVLDRVIEDSVGGSGNDTVQVSGDASANLSDYANTENMVYSGTANAVMTGTAGANWLQGDRGDDTLDGAAGNDTLLSGDGADWVTAGDDNDSLLGGNGDDTLDGGTGNDTIDGGAGADSILGGAGSDLIVGGIGNDTLDGGTGTDTLRGGQGDDVYVVSSLSSVIDEIDSAGGGGNDLVITTLSTFTVNTAQLADIERLEYQGSSDFTGTGNSLDNVLTGGSGKDTLDGGTGADTMSGGQGDDYYIVDNINDLALERVGEGNDTVEVRIDGWTPAANVENVIFNGSGNRTVTGNQYGNFLQTGGGNDTLIGDSGPALNLLTNGGFEQTTISGSYLPNVPPGPGWTYSGGTAGWLQAGNTEGHHYFGMQSGSVDSLTQTVSTTSGQTYTLTFDVAVTGSVQIWFGGNLIGTVSNTAGYQSFSYTVTGSGSDVLEFREATSGSRIQVDNVGLYQGTDTGSDTLVGGAGNDYLDGGAGADSMVGGTGSDVYIVDTIWDKVVETNTTVNGVDEIRTTLGQVNLSTWANVEKLTYIGTGGADLTGTGASETITGGQWNDVVRSGGGNDWLLGGAGSVTGDDTLISGAGSDTVIGRDGNDSLISGGGTDSLVGGTGNDTYQILTAGTVTIVEAAGEGIDTVQAGGGVSQFTLASTVTGNSVENLSFGLSALTGGITTLMGVGNELDNLLSNDFQGASYATTLVGGLGNDTLNGGSNIDSLVGGQGNDTYRVSNIGDVVVEDTIAGSGVDTILYSGFGAFYQLQAGTYTMADNVENAVYQGSNVAIRIIGNASDNVIDGKTGNGTSGGITLEGGLGNDLVVAATQWAGGMTLDGGAGNDTVSLANFGTTGVMLDLSAGTLGTASIAGFEHAVGGGGVDTLIGDGGDNYLAGMSASDSLSGGTGNDTLDGGTGVADTMVGGLGDDLYLVDSASDVVNDTSAGGGSDTVWASVSYTLAANTGVEVLMVSPTLTGGISLAGSAGIETIVGGSGNDTLNGMAGADSVVGGGGDDWFVLTTVGGSDTLVGGVGNDTYNIGASGATIVEAPGSGGGSDTVNITASGVTVSLSNVEYIDFGPNTGWFSVNITGNDANTVDGSSLIFPDAVGYVTINTDGGDDLVKLANIKYGRIDGGAGDDTLDFSSRSGILSSVSFDMTTGVIPQALTGFGVSDWPSIVDVTAVNFENYIGYGLQDIVKGTTGNNYIGGLGGNDSLVGNGGNDTLDGGSGNDTLVGGAGDDSLIGGAGNDSIIGNGGNDTLLGGADNDSLFGGAGNSVLDGGLGNDTIVAGSGRETITGGGGTDWLTYANSSGAVTIDLRNQTVTGGDATGDVISGITNAVGGAGNDTLTGGAGPHTLLGGGGTDWADYSGASAGVGVSVFQALPAEWLAGGASVSGVEVIRGSSFADYIDAFTGGTQTVVGGLGNDTILVDSTDSVDAGGGDDWLIASGITTTVDGGAGIDTLDLSGRTGNPNTVNLNAGTTAGSYLGGRVLNFENVLGSNADDVLIGSDTANNLLVGNAGNDSIQGGSVRTAGAYGDDTLLGGAGNDSLYGGTGNDSIDGGADNDLIVGNGGRDTLLGNDGNDSIVGGTNADSVDAGLGNDTIVGGGGNDTLLGNDGNDSITGGVQADFVDAGNGNDILVGGGGSDTMLGGAGSDSLVGSSGADSLLGGDGNDTLDGGTGGTDFLLAGNGDDRLLFSGAAFGGGGGVNGGAGTDTLVATGNMASVTGSLFSAVVTNVEVIDFRTSGVSATLTFDQSDVNAITGTSSNGDLTIYKDGNDAFSFSGATSHVYADHTDWTFGNGAVVHVY